MLQPINKHTVLKEVRQNGIWQGYITPNNVNSYHIKGGWHIGINILIASDRDGKPYVINRYYGNDPMTMPFEELESVLNSFKYYNCNSELGKRICFWQE